jgi:phosphoribosyl-AMP cyclohydrolase
MPLNREALERLAHTGRLHYYHPRQRKVVAKGEASGHFQEVVEVRLNCRGDQLLLKVRPAGGPASWATSPASSAA